MIQAVTFDLGDTLTDLGEGRGDYEARSLVRAGRVFDVLEAGGLALPKRSTFCSDFSAAIEGQYQASLSAERGLRIEDALEVFFREARIDVNDGLLQGIVDAYCGAGALSPVPLRPGALETLGALQASGLRRIGLISNTIQPARCLDASLERTGVLAFCHVRVYSSEVGVAKPHPAIFQEALDALDVPAGQAVHVGDRLLADVYGAQNAGMRAVQIEVAHRHEWDSRINPDARIRELPELLDALNRLARI
jgi:FMN phosphatase YigB (HAD superfamily)